MIPNSWDNPVREKLRAGESVIGATITAASVEIAAQMAQMGFDFLWIEMEHSPITLETLRHMVLATRGLPAIPIARVPVVELWTAKRVLDCGALGVIFPFCGTPELAALAASSCKYPPTGLRGSGAGLAQFRWQAEEGYIDFADRTVITIVMIEEARAIDKIDEIAATPGVDVLYIGTSDLSFSLGLRGRQDDPLLQEALRKVVAAANKHGKFVGRPGLTAAKIAEYQEQGFRFFQSPAEVRLLEAGARQLLDPLRKSADSKPKAMY